MTDKPQSPSMFTPEAAVATAIAQLVDVSNGLGLMVTLGRHLETSAANTDDMLDARTYVRRVQEALAHCHEAADALRTLLPAKPA